jgi:cytochrome P450
VCGSSHCAAFARIGSKQEARKTERADLPPGPWYPVTIQSIGQWARPLPFLERCRRRYGKRFTLRFLGAPPFVVLSDPDDAQEVFKAPPEVLHPGEGARVLEPLVGSNSVILLDEARHMEQRKLMLPAFHGEKMKRLASLMAEVAEREVESWPRGEAIELHPRMQRLTLEIILRAVFGLDPGARLDALRDRLGAMLAFGDRPISLVPPPPDSIGAKIGERIGPFKEFINLQEPADAMIFELIDERRREDGERDDVLTMLLAARHENGSPMSPQELRDELMTLLVAGHETTASALAWGFERLSREPAVLARLVEEIDGGEEDRYLTATIQETLRRRPVLPNVEPRLVMTPFEVGGWRYPAGVCLVPNAYLIHHDPEIYPDPYAFRPERFLEHPPGTYTWIPFGGGRRRCLGASFAIQEMAIVLRAVLSARELEPASDGFEVAKRRNITIKPARGARTTVRERTPAAAVPA